MRQRRINVDERSGLCGKYSSSTATETSLAIGQKENGETTEIIDTIETEFHECDINTNSFVIFIL